MRQEWKGGRFIFPAIGKIDLSLFLLMTNDAVELLKSADVEEIAGFNHETVPGSVIHEMGTARMGRHPRSGATSEARDLKTVDFTQASVV